MSQDPQHSGWDAPHTGQQPVEPWAAQPDPPVAPAPVHGPPQAQHPHAPWYPQQAPQGYSGVPAAAAPPAPVSSIVLLVLSSLVALATIGAVVGIAFVAPAVLSGVSLARHRTDPAGARRLTRIGWWVFGGLLVVSVVLAVALVVFALAAFAPLFTYGGVSSSGGI